MFGPNRTSALRSRVKPGRREGRRSYRFGRGVTPKANQSLEPPWYGPVCLVVWEGRSREAPPYPDLWPVAEMPAARLDGRFLGNTCPLGQQFAAVRHRPLKFHKYMSRRDFF